MATAALMPTTAIRGGIVMSVNRTCSLMSAFLLAAVAVMGSSAAFAQNRQFSFAYDQPKSSGYGVGAEMFNKKLMELSKGTLSINQYPGAQLGTEAQTLQKVQTGDIDFVLLRPRTHRRRNPNPAGFRSTLFSATKGMPSKCLPIPK